MTFQKEKGSILDSAQASALFVQFKLNIQFNADIWVI